MRGYCSGCLYKHMDTDGTWFCEQTDEVIDIENDRCIRNYENEYGIDFDERDDYE